MINNFNQKILLVDEDANFLTKKIAELKAMNLQNINACNASKLNLKTISQLQIQLIILGILDTNLPWRLASIKDAGIPVIILSKYFTKEMFQKISSIPYVVQFLRRESSGLELFQAIKFNIRTWYLQSQKTKTAKSEENSSQQWFKVNSRLERINVQKVLWLESIGRCTKVYSSNEEDCKLLNHNLTDMEIHLNDDSFIRINRKHIINISKVTATTRALNRIFIRDKEFLISKIYRNRIINKLSA